MKRKILSIVLALMMVVGLLPMAALAAAGLEPVAEINGTKYDTLPEVFAAAKDGDTVTLLRDVETNNSEDTMEARIIINKAITLNLNDKTIKSPDDMGNNNTNFTALIVAADVTINATTGGINTGNNGAYAINVISGATLTINGGTYYGGGTAVQVQKGTLIINDGHFSCEPFGEPYGYKYLINCIDAAWKNSTAKVSIKGGTFVKFDPSDSASENPNGNFLAEGYGVKQDGDNYIVTEPVAAIGDTKYPTLAEAIAAADNSTVTLLKDTTEDITIPSGKTITLDLNGKKLTNINDNTITVAKDATLTVTGTGTVDNVTHGKAAVYNKGTVILAGGTYERSAEAGKDANDNGGNSYYTVLNHGIMTVEAGVVVNNKGKYSSLFENGYYNYTNRDGEEYPKLTINGGTFDGGLNTIKNDDNATLTIEAGTFQNYTQAAFQNHHIATVKDGAFIGRGSAKAVLQCGVCSAVDETHDKHQLTISGGYFFGEIKKTVGTISITSGLFSSDPSDYIDSNNYHIASTDNGSYPYAVLSGPQTKTPIIVKDNTTVAMPTVDGLSDADKTNISQNTKVDGVAEAVADKKADLIPDDVNTENATKVEVEVSVKVEVKSAVLSREDADKTLTFEAKPVATITVTKDGSAPEVKNNVEVPNSLLSGDITVKLPLPTGFTPKQIKHISSDRSVEYFILNTAEEANLRGAKTFKIVDGCAVFTITKFSIFELSGTVTYVEPVIVAAYQVTVNAAENGTVTSNRRTATRGQTVTLTVAPEAGCQLDTLTVTDRSGNAVELTDKGNGTYTFKMPASKVTVAATFKKAPVFTDAGENNWYTAAILWAAEKGVALDEDGSGLFRPMDNCTRADMVTFLWRVAGCPEPTVENPFTDVKESDPWYKAALWAYETGVTKGYGSHDVFAPNAVSGRAQTVLFLQRAVKGEDATGDSFTDVPAGYYYEGAVYWALQNEVTKGYGDSKVFGPEYDCNRAEIITFIYRLYNK